MIRNPLINLLLRLIILLNILCFFFNIKTFIFNNDSFFLYFNVLRVRYHLEILLIFFIFVGSLFNLLLFVIILLKIVFRFLFEDINILIDFTDYSNLFRL